MKPKKKAGKRKARVALVDLKRLLDEGKRPGECAKLLSVTPQYISILKKRLRVGSTRNSMMEEAHSVLAQSGISVEGQIEKICQNANELLDASMAWIRGDDQAIQVLESQGRKVRVGQGEETKEVTEYKLKDPRDIALRAMGEIRQQMRLIADIKQMLFDQKAAEEFQKIVIEAIGDAAPDVRDRIVRELQARHALRAAIQITPSVNRDQPV